MNKVILLVCSLMFIGMTAFSQDSSVATDTKTKNCIPTKACAKKMGMTLEACKKICGTKGLQGKSSVASSSSEADVESLSSIEGKKACCKSLEECAKKSGMTIEECKAKCAGMKNCKKGDSATTQVAAASATTIIESGSADKKACCKKGSKKHCTK